MSKTIKFLLPILIGIVTFVAYKSFSLEEKQQRKQPVIVATKPSVVFQTNLGSFTIELDQEKAPITVANFLNYVNDGFYKNTLFHRVIPGFMVQGGGFDTVMKQKKTNSPIKNESSNGLKNVFGSVSMARKPPADSATSQFFINMADNGFLDKKVKEGGGAGYAVFGRISQGMEVVKKIAAVETMTYGRFRDVPKQPVRIISANIIGDNKIAQKKDVNKDEPQFIAGEHYIVLDKPYPTSDKSKVEVLEAFSYGCGHCYGIVPELNEWLRLQKNDVDFKYFPAVWNNSMKLYARAFYSAQRLNVTEKIHIPLFEAIVVKQKKISTEDELATFFANYGVSKKKFKSVFNSPEVDKAVLLSEIRTRGYDLASVPEVVVNGKYRVNPMRAGGQEQMFELIDFLVNKERSLLR